MVIRAKDDERVLLEKPFFAKEKVSKKIRYVITDALKENWIYMILAIFLGLVAYFGILKIYKVQ
jgi:glucose-6-phosphate 1-dehydrogenase